MLKDEQKKFIQKSKEAYYKIGAVPCPAFAGELVYFNRHGWNHLIQKDRKMRDFDEKVRRINLLKYAAQIIRVIRYLADCKESIQENSHIIFWAAHQKIDGIRIRAIIRQRNNGKKHFFSIMEE
jgi:hypothetical protein